MTTTGMSTRNSARDRRGFTIIEMMISLVLTLMVFAITIPFFKAQSLAVEKNIGRMDAMQTGQLAQAAIDRELRLAGGVEGQPIIVQAAPFALTFNVDLVSRIATDANATYYTPTADSLATEAWSPARSMILPTSGSKVYPPTLYTDPSGVQSQAETISYFLKQDLSGGRTDIYSLFRRVNDRDSVMMARNLWIPADTGYFFRYTEADSATGTLSVLANAALPRYWDGSGQATRFIRIVSMRVATLYRDARRQQDVIRTLNYNTTLLNAGLLRQRTCGTVPLPARNVAATVVVDGGGAVTNVNVVWDNSLEEAGGERDVALYIIQRRLSASTDWEILSQTVANNSASYSFDDYDFKPGSWVYGVVAQDCSPTNSPTASATAVVIP